MAGDIAVDLQLRTEYWDDPEARAAFKAFVMKIHGLDLSEWESAGYWDPAYTPFSYFSGEEIVASVCIYLLDAVVAGEPTRLAQISGVGTLPEWRRRGLSGRLTDIGLDWAKGRHRGIFLFADAGAVAFYRRSGFRPIDEYVEVMEVGRGPGRGRLLKLDPGTRRDLERIHRFAARRGPVSDRFSVLNDRLFMFHVLGGLRDHVYEVPDLHCLVLFKREGSCLRVFDVVAEEVPKWRDLYRYIARDEDRRVEFHFSADKLGAGRTTVQALTGNNPFVKGPFPVERPVFPYTSRA